MSQPFPVTYDKLGNECSVCGGVVKFGYPHRICNKSIILARLQAVDEYKLANSTSVSRDGLIGCTHCDGFGDISGEYPGEACPACNGEGKYYLADTKSEFEELIDNIEWPKMRNVGRYADMGVDQLICLALDDDNDVCVSVSNRHSVSNIEFCVPFSGGGKSPKTRLALIALMVAMESDNANDPERDFFLKRNITPASGESP